MKKQSTCYHCGKLVKGEAEARIKSVKFQCITATLEGVLAMAQTEATLRKSDSWALAAGLLIETLKEIEEFNPAPGQRS